MYTYPSYQLSFCQSPPSRELWRFNALKLFENTKIIAMNSLAQCNRQKYNCMPYTYNTLNIIHVSRHLSTVFLRYRMAVSCKGIEYKNIQLRRIVRSGCF